jgi:hypothetical protein
MHHFERSGIDIRNVISLFADLRSALFPSHKDAASVAAAAAAAATAAATSVSSSPSSEEAIDAAAAASLTTPNDRFVSSRKC